MGLAAKADGKSDAGGQRGETIIDSVGWFFRNSPIVTLIPDTTAPIPAKPKALRVI